MAHGFSPWSYGCYFKPVAAQYIIVGIFDSGSVQLVVARKWARERGERESFNIPFKDMAPMI